MPTISGVSKLFPFAASVCRTSQTTDTGPALGGLSGARTVSHLEHMGVAQITIDPSFVQGFGPASNDQSLIRALCALAHALGISVLAEGVETEEQLALIRAAECDHYQGFLSGVPLEADEVTAHIASGTWV